jgi:hypothetical protein
MVLRPDVLPAEPRAGPYLSPCFFLRRTLTSAAPGASALASATTSLPSPSSHANPPHPALTQRVRLPLRPHARPPRAPSFVCPSSASATSPPPPMADEHEGSGGRGSSTAHASLHPSPGRGRRINDRRCSICPTGLLPASAATSTSCAEIRRTRLPPRRRPLPPPPASHRCLRIDVAATVMQPHLRVDAATKSLVLRPPSSGEAALPVPCSRRRGGARPPEEQGTLAVPPILLPTPAGPRFGAEEQGTLAVAGGPRADGCCGPTLHSSFREMISSTPCMKSIDLC